VYISQMCDARYYFYRYLYILRGVQLPKCKKTVCWILIRIRIQRNFALWSAGCSHWGRGGVFFTINFLNFWSSKTRIWIQLLPKSLNLDPKHGNKVMPHWNAPLFLSPHKIYSTSEISRYTKMLLWLLSTKLHLKGVRYWLFLCSAALLSFLRDVWIEWIRIQRSALATRLARYN
jgi:hypothetical protein